MLKLLHLALVCVVLTTLSAASAHAQQANPTVAESAPPVPYAQQYGLAVRGRYVTVPSWFLGLFTERNSPLHTAGFVLEGFRRKDNFDMAVALGYQNMSPPDGNWLGRTKDPAFDTDLVQVKGMRLISLEVSFVWNNWLNENFGLYYGAGLGLGILTGKVLRTSAGNCAAENAGDLTQCKPIICRGERCTEAELRASETRPDGGPAQPHRFKEDDVPGALPIVNLVAGAALRFPELPGLELRVIEGGFHNAFFVGSSVAYLF